MHIGHLGGQQHRPYSLNNAAWTSITTIRGYGTKVTVFELRITVKTIFVAIGRDANKPFVTITRRATGKIPASRCDKLRGGGVRLADVRRHTEHLLRALPRYSKLQAVTVFHWVNIALDVERIRPRINGYSKC